MVVAIKRAENYQEAHEQFLAWKPKTLQREGAGGRTFDYLPVQNYENYLDETIGPENWETDMSEGSKGVVVRLSIFGVSKASTSDIWPAGKIKKTSRNGDTSYIDNPQPNEVNKAEARAFRRAAAKHGMLRYLWDKTETVDEDDEDDRPARPAKPSYAPKSTNQSNQSKSGQNGSSGASPAQAKFLNDAFGVPGAVAAQLGGGRDGTASQLITLLKDYKSKNEDAYESDPTPFIQRALKKIDSGLLEFLDDENDIDED